MEENIENASAHEIIVIEELIKGNHPLPLPQAARYRFRVDRQTYDTPKAELTGTQILAFAGKTPEQYKLYEHKPRHQPVEVKPDEVVDLRGRGVERFTTMPKDTTEGRGDRAQFRLPADDEAYLHRIGNAWETVNHGGQWLLIHDWKLPTGYNQTVVSLALPIAPSYPDGEIDMVYVSPSIARLDGRTINAVQEMEVCGACWQRWSRHRTSANPWRPGIDDIISHLGLIDSWFRSEIERMI